MNLNVITDSFKNTAFDVPFASGESPTVLLLGTYDFNNIQWYTLDIERILFRLNGQLEAVLLEGSEGEVSAAMGPLTPVGRLLGTSTTKYYFNDNPAFFKKHHSAIKQNDRVAHQKFLDLRNQTMLNGTYGITKFNGPVAQVIGLAHLKGLMDALEQEGIPYLAAAPSVPMTKKDAFNFIDSMQLAQSEDKSCRKVAAEKLGDFPLVIARGKLEQLSSDSSALVTRAAVKSLRKMGVEENLPVFYSLLGHPDEETRWCAAAALRSIDCSKKKPVPFPRRLKRALPFVYAGVSSPTADDLSHSDNRLNAFILNHLGLNQVSDTLHAVEKKYDKSKILGSVYGSIVGDARGFPVENLTLEEIDNMYGRVSAYINSRLTKGARISDDSQMILATIRSILNEKQISLENMTSAFANAIEQDDELGVDHGYSMNTRRNLRCYLAGLPRSMISTPSLGAGALMRVGPVVACAQHLKEAVIDTSKITHTHPGAIAAAYGASLAIHLAYISESIDPENFILEIEKRFGEFYPLVSQRFDAVRNALAYEPDEAFNHIGRGDEKSKWGKGGINVLEVGLYSFLKSPDDFEKAVSTAIYNDGDSDTIGAFVGALSGAYGGVDVIPEDRITQIPELDKFHHIINDFARVFGKKSDSTS